MKICPVGKRQLLFFLLCIVALSAFLMCAPQLLYARAGGGEGFGGGGGGFGGGGGGFSGGFSGGGSSFPRSRGPSGPPPSLGMILFSLSITIGVFLFFGYLSRNVAQKSTRRRVRAAAVRQADLVRYKALQEIERQDPAFELKNFLNQVEFAFLKIQQAWSDQDLSQVRTFISDGIKERFELQIQMMKDQGLRNIMEKVEVLARQDSAAFVTEQFQTIHVRIRAQAIDYNVHLQTGKRVTTPAGVEEFVEYWTFHRKPGVKSRNAAGWIEGNCPRCASPLTIVDSAKCPGCGAQVNSGEYDWVLAEITQESEFQVPGTEQDLPGVANLQQADPGFSIPHLEDRVSVMFWRLRASEYYADPKYVAAIAHPDYLKTFCDLLTLRNRYQMDAAMGQVELIDAVEFQKESNLLRVKVRWSGILKQRDGQNERILRGKSIQTEVFTLIRKIGVKSDEHGVFSSSGCPACGAPLKVDNRGGCEYCGSLITDGSFDWVLLNVEPFDQDIAVQHVLNLGKQREAYPESLATGHAVDTPLALAILAQSALIDGVIDERERRTLHELGAHRSLSPAQVEEIIQHAHAMGSTIPKARNQEQAIQYLNQLIHVFLADGVLSSPERKMLLNYAQYENIPNHVVQAAIQQETKRVRSAAAKVD